MSGATPPTPPVRATTRRVQRLQEPNGAAPAIGCPTCAAAGAILETRPGQGFVRRRYECLGGHRWTTIERLLVPQTCEACGGALRQTMAHPDGGPRWCNRVACQQAKYRWERDLIRLARLARSGSH